MDISPHYVSNFPDVIGCIDGTSINIQTPAHKIKSTYCNRHDIPSITLQAICDSNKKFIDVFTGAPGKIHDARVYKLSFISKKIPQLCGAKYHLLGDGAYSLRKWLITPYRDYGNLSASEIRFNKIFSCTRVLIENTFGHFRGRFRQLQKLEIHAVDKIVNFIIACCVLHNICIDNKDETDDEWYYEGAIDEEENEVVNESQVILKEKGEAKRERIKNLF
ncbi:hypothetical protein NQ314_007635 [Rhamnusium bicolor]|uniref:DDE Tnp4 domain-containing protein n=1 Tax=Rhamnusium bicolor TaxID=1586634 RepID=A0AAV8YMC4_9CUCU|nr:hypothetical protein NQ314_007635 [Rhamnusium bicolor]